MNKKQWWAFVLCGTLGMVLGCAGVWVMDQQWTFNIADWSVKADKSAVICAICAIIGLGILTRMMFILKALYNGKYEPK